ncbi:hypothetical protein HMP0721_1218 [Pseudoramibacter alactolyticus ATCC 23263]|uniref:Uncharacterized protein n=1 Tax=Pseudoramibacter alactolyticus ATCC 23263 TaxID=887929 RepID=E6MGT5_9FIRM|nr:hypothetical protein HMP0721_1218 [Pseudoramibacter alactolyticus ATCC 23263]
MCVFIWRFGAFFMPFFKRTAPAKDKNAPSLAKYLSGHSQAIEPLL